MKILIDRRVEAFHHERGEADGHGRPFRADVFGCPSWTFHVTFSTQKQLSFAHLSCSAGFLFCMSSGARHNVGVVGKVNSRPIP